MIETSLANVNAVGQQWLADPAPLLRQILANQLQMATNFPAVAQALVARLGEMNPADPTSVPATIQQFITNQMNGVGTLADTLKSLLDQYGALMSPADPFGVPALIQEMLGEIGSGEFEQGFTTFASLGVAVGFPLIMAGFPIAGVISQPFKDLANIIDPTGVASQPLRNIANVIDRIPQVLPSILLNGVLGPVNAVGLATAATLEDLVGAVTSADPVTFVSALLNAPAHITGALLNGYTGPDGFTAAGLFGGPFGISAIGSVLNAIDSLANAIASPGTALLNNQRSLTTSTSELASVADSPLNSGAGTTVTLDIAQRADENAAIEPASSPAADAEAPVNELAVTEPSAVDAVLDIEPAVDAEAAPEPDQVKVSLKAEPGKTGMGTTDSDEAKPVNGVGGEGTAEEAADGSATPTGSVESTPPGETGADAGNSDASASADSTSAGSSGGDGS